MTYHHLTYQTENHIALITLDNPGKMNAMTGEMLVSFSAAIEAARHDDDVRVLVITGSGRGFVQVPTRNCSSHLPRENPRRAAAPKSPAAVTWNP